MPLSQLIEKYLALAGAFGRAVPLERFGLSAAETEQVFGFVDEDYHISRYFHFTNESGGRYNIGGERCTHVAVDADVRAIL